MDDQHPTKPFAQWLQEQRGGGLHGELSDALAELVGACIEHGKDGTLTLAVKVHPNDDGVTLTLRDDVTVKAPKPDRGAALFFADSAGNLSRRDPRQPELPLREVSNPQPATTETEAI